MKKNTNNSDVISFWKPIYYEFRDLVRKERIFSKLPHRVMVKLYYNRQTRLHERLLNYLKNSLVIPALMLWKIFPVKIEQIYYSWKYPMVSTLENLKNNDFEFLFVLNTRDHIITALPVLESIDKIGEKILVVTFKEVYSKYREDFNRLNNAKIVFFEYELKNLPLKEYWHISKEVNDKIRILKTYDLDKTVKNALLEDLNYVEFHIKTELVQYNFFKNIFEYSDLKSVVSIVFTTAFEIAKKRNIPSFILQHGIGGTDAWPYISDYLFAYDDVTKIKLDELLDGTVEVLPLGAPRFEYLKSRIEPQKKKNTKFHKKIVTFISQGAAYDTQTTFHALKKLRSELPDDVGLTIKLHPRENLNESNTKRQIERIFTREDLRNTRFIRNEVDFYEVMANSNIMITATSTGMQEAIACDLPVLQINFTGNPYPKAYDLSSFGWRTPIDDPNIMVNETLSILSDSKKYEEVIKKQRWLKNRMLKNFGNCGKVIAETIVDICKRERKGEVK